MTSKVAIVIVLYKSIPSDFLNKICDDIKVIFVDNTPERVLNISSEKYIYVSNGRNLGIAEAQNVGIEVAMSCGVDFIIFFDQDSHFDQEYIGNIVNEYIRIESFQHELFLLGPRTINERQSGEYKSLIHKEKSFNNFIPKREIISSGSCIRVSKINYVGYLDSGLFMDLVDFEWCWRANKKGLKCGISNNIEIRHSIGQKLVKVWKMQLIMSAPFRNYFQIRNYLILIRRSYVPIMWKITYGVKMIVSFLFSFFWPNARKRIVFYIKGFKDGILKKMNYDIC